MEENLFSSQRKGKVSKANTMPKIPRSSLYETLSRHFEDSWTSEIVAICFSGLCLIAMVIVLREFEFGDPPYLF